MPSRQCWWKSEEEKGRARGILKEVTAVADSALCVFFLQELPLRYAEKRHAAAAAAAASAATAATAAATACLWLTYLGNCTLH